MITARVKQFIIQEGLLDKHEPVIVALSGGADSVALLSLLLELGYHCEAAHCNFQLRGQDSLQDEEFTRNLCTRLNVKLHTITFNTIQYAEEHKISIEMAARELRYNWFKLLSNERGIKAVAVAHHKDDSIETLLLNLIRGTGINGLLGIRPKHGLIVRPLLCVSRQEIIEYLHTIDQSYATDRTNFEETYTRNKIRLSLIPLMETINPSVKESLLQTAHYLQDVDKIYRHTLAKEKEQVLTNKGIDIEALLGCIAPETLLFDILSPLGFNSTQISNIYHALTGTSGKQFTSSEGYMVIKDRTHLLIKKTTDTEAYPPTLSYDKIELNPDFTLTKDKLIAYFDADKLHGDFSIRKWQKGDWFVPFGMKGKKLVSDYLTDRKFSLIQKNNQWVLCSGHSIAWVIGERSDNRFRIDETTQYVIKVSVQGE